MAKKKKKIYNAITGEFETQSTTSKKSSTSSVSKGYDATKGSFYDIAPVKETTPTKKSNLKSVQWANSLDDGYDLFDLTKTGFGKATNYILGIDTKTGEKKSTLSQTTSTKKDEDIAPVKDTTVKEEYIDTGKTYGDYWYQEYGKRKSDKIYKKGDKYYIYNARTDSYDDVDRLSYMTTAEADKKALEEAKKQGYKGNASELAHISDKLKLDTADLTKEEYKKYEESLLEQQEEKDEDLAQKNKVRYSGTGLDAFKEIGSNISDLGYSAKENIVEPIADAKENYNFGKMTEDLGMEAYKKMMGEENNYDKLKKEYDKYVTFNQDIVSEGNYLDQTIQTLPNQIGGLVSGVKGGGIGGVAGAILGGTIGAVAGGVSTGGAGIVPGALKGATLGGKWLGGAGYVGGQSQYTYKLEAGLQYQTLIDMGVPEDIAKKEAKDTGTFNALVESGESILDLVTLGSVSKLKTVLVGDLVEKYGKETVGKWIGQTMLTNTITEGIEEGVQEGSSIYNERQAMEQAGLERDNSGDFERIKESVIAGAFAGGLMGGGSAVVTSGVRVGVNSINDAKIKSNVEAQIETYEAETGVKLTEEQKQQLIQETTTEIKNRIAQQSEDIAPVQVDEQALRSQNYQYKAQSTDSVQRRTISEDASKYANNTTRTHEFVETMVNVSEATGETIRLTNNQSEEMTARRKQLAENYARINNVTIEEATKRFENTTIDAYNTGKEIVINLDSPKALNRLVGHEVTHSLEGTKEYSNLQKIAIEYAKTKGEYNDRVSTLQALYEGTNANIDNELTSDLVGDYLFTDQQFVNQIHTQDRNLFQRIYDEIKHLIKMATSGSKEARQLEQLKHSFEKAMRENKQSSKSEVSQTTTQESKSNLATEVESNTQEKEKQVTKVENAQKQGKTSEENTEKALKNEKTVQEIKETPKKEVAKKKTGTPTQAELDSLENTRQNKSGSEYALEFFELRDKYGEANLYKGLNNYKATGKALEQSIKDNTELYNKIANERQIVHMGNALEILKEGSFSGSIAVQNRGLKPSAYKGSKEGIVFTPVALDYVNKNKLYKGDGGNTKLSNGTRTKENPNKHTSIEGFATEDTSKRAITKYNEGIIERENAIPINTETVEYIIVNNETSNPELMALAKEKGFEVKFLNDNRAVYTKETKVSDNKGRALTKEQQDYFKNSKVRDENGNLLTMYHGTSSGGHTVFDPWGAKVGLFGQGSYFTDNQSVAESYTEKGRGNNQQIYEVYLNITNPIDMDAQGDVQAWAKALSSYGTDIASHLESGTNEQIYRSALDYLAEEGTYDKYERAEIMAETFEKMGYDGITHIGGGRFNKQDGTRHRVYISLDSSQVKNVDNTNPTQDPDIRYSLSEDSEGRKLSEKQQEYFNGSKAIDENGNLKILYHGTPNEFNKFSYEHLGTNGTLLGKGFYLTDDINVAQAYANKGENGKVMELYVDIKKPLKWGETTISKQQFKKFVEEVNQATEGRLFADYSGEYSEKGSKQYNSTLNDILMDYEYGGDDIDLVSGILNATGMSWDKGYKILKDTTGYDGIIVTTDVYDSGEGNVYIPFQSYQIKNVDNLNPTDDVDIRKSLSNENTDIAPTSADIFGSEIKLQEQVQEAIAPLQETIQELNNKITTLQESIAPIEGFTDEDVSLKNDRNFESLEAQNIAPIENTTPEYQYENSNEETPITDPFENRDIKEVGNRKVKAYMYENPEVKPYFQQAAGEMLSDLDNSIKGEKVWLQEYNPVTGLMETNKVTGTQRQTTSDIAELLDVYHYTYAEIRNGLNAIIEDNGKENNAVSKRIEFMLNDRLLNGYTAIDGFPIPPNNEYRALIQDKNIQEYSEQAYAEWNNSINQDKLIPIENASNTSIEAQNVPLENNLPMDDEITDRIEKTLSNEPKIKNTKYDDPMSIFERQIGREVNEGMTYTKSKPKVSKPKKQLLQDAYGKAQEQFVNRNYYIDKMAKDTGNNQIKFAGDMLNNFYAEIDGDIFTAQTDNNGNAIGGSLSSLFEKSKQGGYYEAFNDYLMHQSNIDRHQVGKGSIVPQDYSRKMVAEYEKMYPTMRAEATKVWKYGKNQLANMQSNGLITGQFNSMLQKMYPHYVPFAFDQEFIPSMSEDGVVRPKKAIKRAEGNAYEILEIEEAFAKYTYRTKRAIRENSLLKEVVKSSKDKISIGADVRTDPTNLEEGYGIDDNGKYYATAYVNGEMQQATISEELYNELTKSAENRIKDAEQRYELITKPLQAVSEVRRKVLTQWNPMFIARNMLMDPQDAVLNSKYPTQFLKYYPTALAELAQANTKEAKQFLTLYGSGNTMGEFNSDKITQTNAKNKSFMGKVSQVGNLVELAPRYAEFKATIKDGKSVQEAMYNAREVTTNFGRGGYITKALNRNGFTFLNTSVQGFDKLVRNFSGENGARGVVSSLAKVSAFAVIPALFNALSFDDDEEYEALPDYIKDNYYLIKTGDGEFIRIHKGRMVSVFGSAGRRTLEYINGNKDAFDGFLSNAYKQVGVQNPIDNNILAPITQAINNEAWYGGDLVPTRLQSKPAEEQYDETTDEFSKWLGQQFGISPYKINYVLEQYSGGVGDILLPMITEGATSDSEGLETLLAPMKDQFTANTTSDNKYVSEFYDTNDKLKAKANSSSATEEDVLRNKYMYSVSSEMSELYQEKREVQNDKTLTKSEKYEKVQEIQKQINSLAEEGLNNYEKINKTSNYAMVGDREFYKNANDEWKTPYDDELDELNSLGMDIEEKSDYYDAKNSIYEITEEYKGTEDKYAEKKTKIIDVVKNSSLTDDQKGYLYSKYYSKEKVQIINTLDMNFNSFLDYESQNFVADKNAKGESISGSKKKKVFDYLNNATGLNFEEKVILAKLEYNTYDEFNYEIIDYLNNSNITYEEEVYILKKLGFTVDNEGNIYWK